MDKRTSTSSIEAVDTSQSDHGEVSDADDGVVSCAESEPDLDIEKVAKSAPASTKRQKRVPLKLRDPAYLTESAQTKLEAEMRDSKFDDYLTYDYGSR